MSDDRKDGGKIHRVGESLTLLTQRLGLAAPRQLHAVFADWEQAVGTTVAAHARPVALRERVLTVEVDEPGWATQLRFLHDDLVRAVNTHAIGAAGTDRPSGDDGPIVERVEVRVAQPSRRDPQAHRRG